MRIIVQNAKGTIKARYLLLRECQSDVILMPDDDVSLEPDYVSSHVRHFADSRVDAVTGPVYEWDAERREWFVKWETHLMLEGPRGRAFMSHRSHDGTNSSLPVASAFALGGWDENVVTYGEDDDFKDRLQAREGPHACSIPRQVCGTSGRPGEGSATSSGARRARWERACSCRVFLFLSSQSSDSPSF